MLSDFRAPDDEVTQGSWVDRGSTLLASMTVIFFVPMVGRISTAGLGVYAAVWAYICANG